MGSLSLLKRSLPTGIEGETKRRKIRKGTDSCWACKRRKVRCHYATLSDKVCDGCKTRNTVCVSQEFSEDSRKLDCNNQICDRLSRVEAIVNQLVQQVNNTNDLDDDLAIIDGESDSGAVYTNPLRATVRPSLLDINVVHASIPNATAEHDSRSRLLFGVWPNARSLDIIFDVPGNMLGVLHGTICAPLSKVQHDGSMFIRECLQQPEMGTHPVLIARKLLILATYIQSFPPPSTRSLDDSDVDHRTIMSSAVERVRSCVTCNEDMLQSIEGVECLMIESMYQNNAGNLRSAWHSIRRAMLTAQLMGLHCRSRPNSITVLETETHSRVDPGYLWFRLVQMDRYLSLMLGMLQGTPNNDFANPQVLEICTPMEQLQRMDCVIGGYILQRNESRLYDWQTTHMIDQLLEESAACVSPSWWKIPHLQAIDVDEIGTVENLLQTMDQLVHYQLLIQLHLPHIMRSSAEHELEHSTKMAMHASREILTRYISLNNVHSFTSWCRGISYLAFTACTSMCVVHLSVSQKRQYLTDCSEAVRDVLADQHQSDRNIMNLTLDCMERIALESKDVIASKTGNMLRLLLSMEKQDETMRAQDMIDSTTGDIERGIGCEARINDSDQSLQIHIPCFGTIKLVCANVP